MASFIRSWALVMQHKDVAEIMQMRRHIANWQATGSKLWQARLMTHLAEAYVQVGQISQGLLAVNEALQFAGQSGERLFEAEIYRLKGELLLMLHDNGGNPSLSEVEACFRQAINVAREQQAKSRELLATLSLSRLRLRQGEPTEARQILADIYNWFTEGFDTPDLLEAVELLKTIA